MKKLIKIIPIIICIIVIVFEILPFSSIMKFSAINEQQEVIFINRYYSCFDITNVGFAHFGPFLSSWISCILLLLLIISMFYKNKSLTNGTMIISIICFISSLFSFFFGYFTIYNILITIAFFIITSLLIYEYSLDNKKLSLN